MNLKRGFFVFFLLFTLQTFAVIDDPQLELQGFDWVPAGKRPRELPDHCSAKQLEKILLDNDYVAMSHRSQIILNYFKECEKYHTFLGDSGITGLLQMYNIDYEYQNIPYIRPVTLTMKDGAILHAVLALKPDSSQPRPIIIAQCGLTCNTINSASVRWPLMHLFDESPFHVLVVGSSTTAEFGVTNKKFYAGGFQEGLYINEIAQWLKSENSHISELISSIHVQGMSLGGHGALYSALYSQEGDQLIKSSQAHCPVVELKPAIDNILRDSLPGRFLQNKIWKQMEQMIGQVPIIDRMIPDGKKPNAERMKEIVAQASLEYLEANNRNPLKNIFKILFKILTNTFPKTIDEFWNSNRFSNLVQNLKTPVMIWSAEDDPAVAPKENALVLLDYANRTGSPLTVLNTERGSHCAFALSHGWDIYSTAMRSFVLANSPEFRERYHQYKRSLSELQYEQVVLEQESRHFSQSFHLERGNPYMRVDYQILNLAKKKCREQDPFLMDTSSCFEIKTANIKIADIKERLLFVPQNNQVAEMLTRWANANLSIVDEDGNRLVNSRKTPSHLVWHEL
ncbi:MAG: hypothetical protein A4S09_06935 [Proteobacteria bacterium SG_bin7]|nr:MAG: hypothetical protein A4S09_06935 [Proteobacteria bacterium SG_bin7]